MEVEDNGSLPFLDTLLQRDKEGNITSRWYSKKIDMGLVMNYHSLAPEIYKRSVVCDIFFIFLFFLIDIFPVSKIKFGSSYRESV